MEMHFSVIETLLRQLPCYLCRLVFQRFQAFLMQQFNLNTMLIQPQHIINIYQRITKLQELNKHCNKHTNSNNKPLFKQLIISYKPGLGQILLKFQAH
jgi:hypothetical protein